MPIRRNEAGKIIAQYPTIEQVEDVINGDNTTGFCLACGAENDGCEPDARKYTCQECELPHVYGAEELVITGRVRD